MEPVKEMKGKYTKATLAKLDASRFSGISIAITGCSSGTGLEVALIAAEKGKHATVYMLNRKSERATAAEATVRARASPTTQVHSIECDLASFASVRSAAQELVTKAGAHGLSVLLLNAGVMAMAEGSTVDGYDMQLQTNHLSHFLLAQLCMPALNKAAGSATGARIVSVSSNMRNFGPLLEAKYFKKFAGPGSLGGNGNSMFRSGGNWVRYHHSKLANIVFTMALNDRLQAAGSAVKALACEPGLATTNLQGNAIAGGGMLKSEWWILNFFFQSAQDGALPALLCCFAPDAQSGDYYAPGSFQNFYGPPVPLARAGVFFNPKAELLSMHAPSRALLWEVSERACGEFRL